MRLGITNASNIDRWRGPTLCGAAPVLQMHLHKGRSGPVTHLYVMAYLIELPLTADHFPAAREGCEARSLGPESGDVGRVGPKEAVAQVSDSPVLGFLAKMRKWTMRSFPPPTTFPAES